MHIINVVEVNCLKVVIEDFYDFFLKKASKIKDETLYFKKDLICNIVIFS